MKPFKYCPHCGEKLMEDTTNAKEMEELDKQFKEKIEKIVQMPYTPYTPYPDPKPWIPVITWGDTKGSEYK